MASKYTQEEIFENYHDKIQYYILKKVQHRETAEDLTSVVFLKIFERYERYDDSKAALSTWIYTIANNTVIDYYRTNRVTEEVPETISAEDSIEDGILMQEQMDELASALETLPERERDLIILHYYQGVKLKDIAPLMGMSYANAKLLHSKALARLRNVLE